MVRTGGNRLIGKIILGVVWGSQIMRDGLFINRFWEKVQKTETCWLWKGAVNWTAGGYGKIPTSRKAGRRRFLSAHRVAWELQVGEIPHGFCVLHRCDTPLCVNPDHLFLGTQTDNVMDMLKKGRQRTNPVRKLTVEQVRQIRALKAEGVSDHELARRFGVVPGNIWNIVARKSWKSIDNQALTV